MSTPRVLLSALVAGSLISCDAIDDREESPSPDPTPQALNSSITNDPAYPCTGPQWSNVLASWNTVKNLLLTQQGKSLIECMKQKVGKQGTVDGPDGQNYVIGRYNSSYPEWIIHQLRTNESTIIQCTNQNTAIVGQTGTPTIKLAQSTLDGGGSGLARTILHELTHAKGFDHFGNFETRMSPNIRVEECFDKVLGGFDSDEIGAQTLEAGLREVGIEAPLYSGGDSYRSTCDGYRLARGVSGFKNTSGSQPGDLTALRLTCKPKNVNNFDSQAPLIGTSGANAWSVNCAAGEVMVGAYGRGDYRMRTVGPICQPENLVQSKSTSGRRKPGSQGIGGATDWERLCPRGMAVKGLTAKHRTFVMTLELSCQDWNAPQPVNVRFAWGAGVPHPQGIPGYDERIPGRGAMTTLAVLPRNGQIVRLGGRFSMIQGDGFNYSFNSSYEFPSHGRLVIGQDGQETADGCQPGQAMIGLRIHSGPYINGVGAVCANLQEWVTRGSAPLDRRPILGSTTGTLSENLCQPYSVLDGWSMTGTDVITSITPHCRQFAFAGDMLCDPAHETIANSPWDCSGFIARRHNTHEWAPGNKTECGQYQALKGIALVNDASHQMHSVLCTKDDETTKHSLGDPCRTLDFSTGSVGNSTDWDSGFHKAECRANEFVAGVSRDASNGLTHVRCCPGVLAKTSCQRVKIYAAEARETGASTDDWAWNAREGECGANRYVAGISRTRAANQEGPGQSVPGSIAGAPHALYCCNR